jgi:hypothetical protein
VGTPSAGIDMYSVLRTAQLLTDGLVHGQIMACHGIARFHGTGQSLQLQSSGLKNWWVAGFGQLEGVIGGSKALKHA